MRTKYTEAAPSRPRDPLSKNVRARACFHQSVVSEAMVPIFALECSYARGERQPRAVFARPKVVASSCIAFAIMSSGGSLPPASRGVHDSGSLVVALVALGDVNHGGLGPGTPAGWNPGSGCAPTCRGPVFMTGGLW